MSSDYLQAYQSLVNESEKIYSTKISKVSYLLKLKAQSNSISDLDRKHKTWGQNDVIPNQFS
ncbi:hypothetical protein DNJ73_05030 [Prochlorococcus marinus XMU1408]|uniref:Uncharacterized protein n=1 Tax=Prochlorococcus marinus XMU1408 TaxID=2213228 RepID=A0A318R1H3_PROMR|nr:hypothetical protein [Prochlorococcus marinus str. XMU1408]PYE03106.1 hypothetical protein DNJ73_05030 [Prochlorococcus marinus XMU1408]